MKTKLTMYSMKTHGKLKVKPNLLFLFYFLFISSISFSQITVNSLTELLPYLKQDNVEVKLTPGTYTVTAEDIQNGLFPDYTEFLGRKNYVLFLVSGNNSVYDFTDVTINVETAVFNAYSGSYDNFYEVQTTGNNNVLKNLTLVDLGSVDDYPKNGACNITMDGSYNRIEGFHITAKGSYPYGYGDSFGKGGTYTIKHYKHSAFLIRGESNHAKGNTIIHRTYGHCMFMQAANNPLIEDCYLEGEMRSTDDMLAETSGPAYDINFMTVWGYKLPVGYMKSTGEAGIRAYNAGETIIDGIEYSRGTSNVTVKNCTIKHLRTGVTVAHATGTKYVEGTTAIGCENGFSLGSGDVVDSYSDVAFGPAYASTYTTDRNYNAEITIIPAEDPYYNGSGNVAYIGGSNHNITLKSAPGLVIDQDLKIKFGGERNHISTQGESLNSQDDFTATNITLDNQTNFAIILSEDANNNSGQSGGMVTDFGIDNNFVHTAVSVSKIEAENYVAMQGVTIEETTDDNGENHLTDISSGDWMEYEVDVQLSGTYTIGYRIASTNSGTFNLSTNNDTLEKVSFSSTGDNSTWNTMYSETPFYLESGTHTIKITSESDDWNFNWLDIALDCAIVTIDPYVEELNNLGFSLNTKNENTLDIFPGNTAKLQPKPTLGGSWAWTGPNSFNSTERIIELKNIEANDAGAYVVTFTNDCGQTSTETFYINVQGNLTIEAEDFDTMSGVETEPTTDSSGTDQVSAIDADDWMEYTINIENPATYAFNFRVSSANDNNDFTVLLNDEVIKQVTFSSTGSTSTWSTINTPGIYLTAGTHKLKITSNSSGWLFNWLQLQGENFVNPCELPFIPDGFTIQNEEKKWSSGLIDISCVSSVNAYVNFTGTENLTSSDYLNIYYVLDGGEKTAISETIGLPSSASGVISNLTGQTLELIIEGNSTSSENIYTISKINIVETTDPFGIIEAEDFTEADGPKIGTTGDVGGGQNLGSIKPGYWSMYAGLDLTGVKSINARVASIYEDAKIEVRLNSSDGLLVGTIDVPNTGGWQTYETASAYIAESTGLYDVYLVYTTLESANVCNINWFQFSNAYIKAPIDPFSQFEAEDFDKNNGTETAATTDESGNEQVGNIQDGDWIMFEKLILTDASSIDLRIASTNDTSKIELRLDAPNGEIFSFIDIPNTGAVDSWQTLTASIESVSGEHDIYVVFKGEENDLVSLNWMQFKVYENPYDRIEAEDFDEQYGDPTVAGSTSDVDGIGDLRGIVPEDWIKFNDIDLSNAQSISARFGSLYEDAFIEVRIDAVDGELIGKIELHNTGGWHDWETTSNNINQTSGTHDVFFIFNSEVSPNVCNINWFQLSEQKINTIYNPLSRIEAENYSNANGTESNATTDEDGENDLVNISDGDWTMYQNIDLTDIGAINVRVASPYNSSSIEVRLGAYDGELISTINVPNTGSYDTWQTVNTTFSEIIIGKSNVYLVYKGIESNLLKINWLQFEEFVIPDGYYEAEDYDDMSGIDTENTSDDNGDMNVGWIQNNDWIMFNDVDLTNISTLDLRYSTSNSNTRVEIRLDSVDGQLIGNAELSSTGDWNSWETITTDLVATNNLHNVYLVFKGGSGYLFNLNWIYFKSLDTPFERIEAEDYDNQQGNPNTKTTSDIDGVQDLRSIVPGDWIMFNDVDLTDAKSVSARIGSIYDDAFIEVRIGSANGDLIGNINLHNTGGWHNWETVSANISSVTGVHDLYFVFNSETSPNVCNINWFHFSNETATMPFEPFVRIEAENYSLANGTQTSTTTDTDGENEVNNIQNDNWLMFNNLNISTANSITIRLASASEINTIEIRLDDYTGELISTIKVPNTGNLTTWATISENIDNVVGNHDVYLVFKGNANIQINVNWLMFSQDSVLSVNDINQQSILIYPNPVSNILNITNGIDSTIEIFDISGKQVLRESILTNQQTIILNGFSNGLYLVKMQNKTGVITKKIVKK